MRKAVKITLMNLFFLSMIACTMAPAEGTDTYCAKLRDGMLVIMKGETKVTSDVILANGTRVQADGIVVKKDGSKIVMKDGDCVDKEGNLVDAGASEKIN